MTIDHDRAAMERLQSQLLHDTHERMLDRDASKANADVLGRAYLGSAHVAARSATRDSESREGTADRDRLVRILLSLAWLIAFVVVSTTCAAILAGCASAGRTPAQQAAASAQVRVWCVAVTERDGRPVAIISPQEGSAVAISPTRALTAAHVARCDAPDEPSPLGFYLRFPSGDVRRAQLEQVDAAREVALLRWDEPLPWVAPAPRARPRPRREVCSEPAVPRRERRCGRVTQVRDTVVSGPAVVSIWSTVPSDPGNSGAGLYDDRGRLIGLVTHTVIRGSVRGSLAAEVRGRP